MQMGEKIMMELYTMPNGRKYFFNKDDVPAVAVKVKKKTVAKKAAKKKTNKSKKAENK